MQVDLLIVMQRVGVELLDDEALVGEARGEVEGFADHDPLFPVDDGLDPAQGRDLDVKPMQVDLNAPDLGDLELDPEMRQKLLVRPDEEVAIANNLRVNSMRNSGKQPPGLKGEMTNLFVSRLRFGIMDRRPVPHLLEERWRWL